MFKMSHFRFDACRESFAKGYNRFGDRFRQIVPDSLQVQSHLRIRYLLWFWFQLTKTY